MNKLDRFNEDYKKLEGCERQIKEFLKERALNIKMGQTTGKVIVILLKSIQVDYLLNSNIDNLRFDLKNMEKLAYIYENEPEKHPEL